MNEQAVLLPVDKLHGIGVVVEDLKSSLGEFSRFFGITEWSVRRLVSGKGFSITSPAGAVDAELLWASGGTRNLRFDIVQPLRGNTCFRAFIDRRGSGVQDISTNVLTPAMFNDVVPKLAREGIGILQTLHFGESGDIHYLDSADQLGTVVKILVPRVAGAETLDGVPVEEVVRYDAVPEADRLPIDRPYHVCVLTKHRRLSVQENFRRIFGIERWFEYDNEVGRTSAQAHYFGRLLDGGRFKLVVGRRERFSVEIVEHTYGESVYRDMLENKGEGIHHVMTTIFNNLDRVEQAKVALGPEGYSIVMDGGAGLIYYGYFAAKGKIADLAVEVLGPQGEGDWEAQGGEEFWAILRGPEY
jgi:hypothetical protein